MEKIDYSIWEKLKDFSLDVPEVSFSFSDRLARENAWSKEYSQRAILEYKKFIFLSYISGKSLTPSDEVDQVWHLHMIYTRSYWVDMCKELLGGFNLHHGPTKGGKAEGGAASGDGQAACGTVFGQVDQRAIGQFADDFIQ